MFGILCLLTNELFLSLIHYVCLWSKVTLIINIMELGSVKFWCWQLKLNFLWKNDRYHLIKMQLDMPTAHTSTKKSQWNGSLKLVEQIVSFSLYQRCKCHLHTLSIFRHLMCADCTKLETILYPANTPTLTSSHLHNEWILDKIRIIGNFHSVIFIWS